MISLLCICICIFLMAIPPTINTLSSKNTVVAEEIFKLLQDGHRKLRYSEKYENVFLFGLSGSGTTTTGLILADDNSKLISNDVGEESGTLTGVYIIKDEIGLIGNSNLARKTILPNLFVDDKNNIAYYDCPGYIDTKNISADITSTYFIKEIVDSSKYFKFIFNINFNFVIVNGSPVKFISLLEYITQFINDIDKYRDAIGVVITKVNAPIQNDEQILSNVAVFFEKTKTVLQNSINQKPFYKNAIKFIDIILQKNNNNNNKYDRLSLMRAPDRPGPLSEIPIIQESKKYIINMISKSMKYVNKFDNDFNYSLSEYTKNNLPKIEDILQEETYGFNENFKKFYEYIQSKVDNTRTSVKNDDLNK